MRQRIVEGLFLREIDATPEGGGTGPPPLLYVHGLGESGLSLEGLAAHPLLAGRRHLVPDLPGYGRSPWPSAPLSLAECADRLSGLLHALSVENAVVLGHSMGGVVALLMAERHPALVRAIVDVEGNKSLDDCTFSSRAESMSEREFIERGRERLLDRVYHGGLSEPSLRGYFASMSFSDPRTFHRHGVELVESSRGEQLARRLANTGLPALYVAGQPRGSGARTLALVEEAGLERVIIEPAGHWPFLDQPERCAAVIANFLSRQPGL